MRKLFAKKMNITVCELINPNYTPDGTCNPYNSHDLRNEKIKDCKKLVDQLSYEFSVIINEHII